MEGKQNSKPTSHGQLENQIVQGSTIRSDLPIEGTKVYSDASWQKKNIPGRGYSPAKGIGIYIDQPRDQYDRNIMIQASADDTHSPLVGEALALQLAAKIS